MRGETTESQIACVASVSVRFSARSTHFSFFSRAKIGASAKKCVTGEGKGEKEVSFFPFPSPGRTGGDRLREVVAQRGSAVFQMFRTSNSNCN